MEGSISAPDIDTTDFVAGLQDMVNNGQMSVDEALAAMDGAQIEADVKTEQQDDTDTKEAIAWEPYPTDGAHITAHVPVTPTGGPLANGATATVD